MASHSAQNRRSHTGRAKRTRPESREEKRLARGAVRNGGLLPGCDGPKMHPFKHRRARILYDALISSNDATNTATSSSGADSGSDEAMSIDDETTSGSEGHVFKVKIDSKVYALKLFKFFDMEAARSEFFSVDNEDIGDKEFEEHIDPFYAECRAYGAIQEKIYHGHPPPDEKDWVAAPCYGYLHISAADEAVIRGKFNIEDWNRPEGGDHAKPIRALVKEFIEQEDAVDTKRRSVRRMRKDLLMIRSAGVYTRDLFARNYRGGLLVDFGQSFTEPHCALRVLPKRQANAEKQQDLRLFYRMMERLRVQYSVRTMPERVIPTRQGTFRRETQDLWELDGTGNARRII
ncbi:uncharacterized protein BKCO1_8300033 [Diplodia corticola]|uniref:Uncharacterized protein n=1 Tax=Diplodia corticola TaxID=236234 RepID=A0A1J9QMQ5_9PEZI|nr:uncharacterized protein BKCO1_8300033 [Diplodia corticola]OJD29354.1 hypothetical protein BKCO1_8300033 [Diplodia corticola]